MSWVILPSVQGGGALSRHGLDHFYDLPAPVALVSSELDEGSNLFEHRALLGSAGHGDASTTTELEQPFVTKKVHRSQHRVLVHAQHGCDVLYQREPFPWSCFSVRDRPTDLGRHLVVEGERIGPVDVYQKHGTSQNRPIYGRLLGPRWGRISTVIVGGPSEEPDEHGNEARSR